LSLDIEAIAGWWLGAITTESEDIPGDKCLDMVAIQNWYKIKTFMREG
jgi:hypothetical protein